MPGIEGKKPGIEFRKSRAAGGAGPFRGKNLFPVFSVYLHHTFTQLESGIEGLPQGFFPARKGGKYGCGQVDRMLLVAVQAGPILRG